MFSYLLIISAVLSTVDLCNFGVACWKCVSVPVAEKLIIALQLVQVKPCLVSGYLWLDI